MPPSRPDDPPLPVVPALDVPALDVPALDMLPPRPAPPVPLPLVNEPSPCRVPSSAAASAVESPELLHPTLALLATLLATRAARTA
jgi:hypothetical protein